MLFDESSNRGAPPFEDTAAANTAQLPARRHSHTPPSPPAPHGTDLQHVRQLLLRQVHERADLLAAVLQEDAQAHEVLRWQWMQWQ